MRDQFDAPPMPAVLPAGDDGPPDDEAVDTYLAAQVGTLDVADDGSVIGAASVTVEHVRAFRLDNDRHAEFYMRKLAAADAELAGLDTLAGEWIAGITAWRRAAGGRVDRRRTWWVAHLEDYARRRRAERLAADKKDPRAKTLILPSGKVSTSRQEPKPKIVDPIAVIDWLRRRAVEHNVDAVDAGWLKVETTPVAAEVKKLLTIKGDDENGYRALCDGEVVPGIEVDGAAVTASVHPGP